MDLDKLRTIDPNAASNFISRRRGIYFWIDKKTNDIVYIGIATGTGGLRRRIISQHLNPNYLEFRKEKQTSKDTYQLNHAVKRPSDNSILKKGIDKSAFRKSVGRALELTPGEGTVSFIKDNLHLKIHESEDIEAIKKLEKSLIKKHQPKFNSTHKRKPR